jgi:hypothetical protein
MLRLLQYNIDGKMFQAVNTLYKNTESCLKINNLYTQWFNVDYGVRQGDNLSPTLFGLFINDLAVEIKGMNKGVKIGNQNISILLYADDIVLLAENEENLQIMLDHMFSWCSKWRLNVNASKSKIMHFRSSRKRPTQFSFTYGDITLERVSEYKYLGVILDEFLDYTRCSDVLSESAGRALGSIISKFKVLKDVGFKTFSKMYDVGVVPIMDYCSGVWGFGKFPKCNSIQNRAIRYFMGVHSFSPNPAIQGDMAWVLLRTRIHYNILKLWNHLINLDEHRLPKKVFNWDYEGRRIWSSTVEQIFETLGLAQIFDDKLKCD